MRLAEQRWPQRLDGACDGHASLLVQIEGQASVAVAGERVLRLGPGECCLLLRQREAWIRQPDASRLLRVDLPVLALPGWPARRPVQRLDAAQPEVRAAATLAAYVVDHSEHLSADERVALGDALLCLVGRVAARCSAAAGEREVESAAARQRRRAEAFILEQLHDRRLDVARIAAHLGVSTRYLHRLFDDGRQVMQWVQEQRLQACWRELAQRRGGSVAEIAWAWGFASPAHFSRAFKKRFGVPPSAV